MGVTICTALMFSADDAWSMGLKIAWIFFMYTFVFCIFGTMRTVANTTYMIRAFSNNRTLIGKVSSYGELVTTPCSMVVSTSFPKLMAKMASFILWHTDKFVRKEIHKKEGIFAMNFKRNSWQIHK